MTTKTQSASPASRFGHSFRLGNLTRSPARTPQPSASSTAHHQPTTPNPSDGWYMPYTGPYEPPPAQPQATSTHGHGHGHARAGSVDSTATPSLRRGITRARSQTTAGGSSSSGGGGGGIGESPMPRERAGGSGPPHQQALGARTSFASLFSNLARRAGGSREDLKAPQPVRVLPHGYAAWQPPAPPMFTRVPGMAQESHASENADYGRRISPPKPLHSEPPTFNVPSIHEPTQPIASTSYAPHPYAYATPHLSPIAATPHSAPPVPSPAWPKSPSSPSPSPTGWRLKGSLGRKSLKASKSTPNLNSGAGPSSSPHAQFASPEVPPLPRSAGAGGGPPKRGAKEWWLSAETWCDALLFPRPRFKARGPAPSSDGRDWTREEKRRERIVSPPHSVVWPVPDDTGPSPLTATDPVAKAAAKLEGVALAPEGKRRSLGKARSNGELRAPVPVRAIPEPPAVDERDGLGELGRRREGRLDVPRNKKGKRYSWDDLAVPSPAPSLTTVLADGERLDSDRKKWQAQATRSIGNSTTRARARSLSKRVATGAGKRPSPPTDAGFVDFIAARTLFGSQGIVPTIHVRFDDGTLGGGDDHTGRPSTGSGHHHHHHHRRSQSHSSGRTNTTSQKSFIPGHTRSESLGRAALRAAKHTAQGAAAGFCGIQADQAFGTPQHEWTHPQQTYFPERKNPIDVDPGRASDALKRMGGDLRNVPAAPSPVPSTAEGSGSGSAEGVGLALATPRASALDLPGAGSPRVEISVPGHPYARTYYAREPSSSSNAAAALGAAEYVGPHPSHVVPAARNDVVARHKLPPQATLLHPPPAHGQQQQHQQQQGRLHLGLPGHPYAAPGGWTGPSPRSTMFADLGDGTVREVYREEMQYSPFVTTPVPVVVYPAVGAVNDDDNGSGSGGGGGGSGEEVVQGKRHAYAYRLSTQSDYEMIGMGDALTYGQRQLRVKKSKESDLGTSEEATVPEVQKNLVLESPPQTYSRGARMLPRKPVPQASAVLPPAPQTMLQPPRPSLPAGQGSDPTSFRTFASSPDDSIVPPQFRFSSAAPTTTTTSAPASDSPLGAGSPHALSSPEAASGSSSSPGAAPSITTSPPLSPRPWAGGPDDLDRFRDLFYRPDDTPSDEDMDEGVPPGLGLPPVFRGRDRDAAVAGVPDDVESQKTSHRRDGSGLSVLARQLSEELEAIRAARASGATSAPSSSSRGQSTLAFLARQELNALEALSTRGGPGREDAPLGFTWSRHLEPEFGDMPDVQFARAEGGTTLPLRLPEDRAPGLAPLRAPRFPEDVSDSRASSILEPSLGRYEQGPDSPSGTGPFRFGFVEALGTPPPVSPPPRFSSHLSFIQEPRGMAAPAPDSFNPSPLGEDDEGSLPSPYPHGDSGAGTNGSLSPYTPSPGTLARASYMTTDTVASRMSALSAFPTPPTLAPPPDATPAHMALLRDYFGGHTPSPAMQHAEDPMRHAGVHQQQPSHQRKETPVLPFVEPLRPVARTEREVRRTTFGQDDFGSDHSH